MRNLTPDQLKDHLAVAENQPLLLDVRQPWEYDICKLDGSELIPMGQLLSNFDELDIERETVVICHHGIRSRQVCLLLEQAGFENLINLSGGLDQWARTIDVTMATY